MPRQPRVGQHQIAQQLGLSVATISRALQGSHEISEETRRDVLRIAARMGYIHRRRHGFRDGEQRPIAVAAMVVGDLSLWPAYSTWPSVMRGAIAQAEVRRVDLSILYIEPDDPASLARMARAVRHQAAAILIHPPIEPVTRTIAGLVPLIGVVHQHSCPTHDVVDADQMAAGTLTAEHLIALGHRQIGFVGTDSHADWCRRRLAGFLASTVAAGITPVVLIRAHGTGEDLTEVVGQTLQHPEVTGWVCANDIVALHVRGLIIGQGIAVPERMSITGVDSWPSDGAAPALTSVRMPFEELGRLAIDVARWRAADPAAIPRRVTIPVALAPGRSTAPPAA